MLRVPNLFVAGTLAHGLISIINLALDYQLLSGNAGLLPDTPMIAGLMTEFSSGVICKYFPSLQYFLDPTTLLLLGIVLAILGISLSNNHLLIGRIASFLVYAILLSFSNSRGILLWFPWDCLLFECLFISVIAPESRFLKRFLLFRVVFGFGKHKFLGADSWDDLTYTQSMACWQPLGSTLGWYLSFVPPWVHVISIVFTFVAEMISPFIILFPHRFSISTHRLACWSIILLMVMIQLTGHFGWFNTLTGFIAVCVLLEASKAPASKPSTPMRTSFRLIYITLAIVFIIPSQWNSPAMFYQHSFDSPKWDVLRVVSSWRLLHTYGVFPPKKMPMIKPVGQFHVTLDNQQTIDLQYYYQSTPTSDPTALLPFFVAPFRFPRFDYIYGFYSASHVFSLTTRLGPIVGTGEEYIDSVANMLLSRSHLAHHYFKTRIPKEGKISSVKFYVLGLTPSQSGTWTVLSRELDKVWEHPVPLITSPVSDMFPLNMVVLRKQSNVFGSSGTVLTPQRQLDRAIINVENRNHYSLGSERQWLSDIESEFKRQTNVSLFSFGNRSGLYDLNHASEFGGYIGCLTFAHLVPYPIHSPICRLVLGHNYRSRKPENRYSKIPIDDFVYTLLGLNEEDLVS